MSRLDELIVKLCPNGVTYKQLGELGKFFGGLSGKTKNDFTDGNATFITYKNVYSNPALDINPEDTVKIARGEKQRTLEFGDVIFTGSSETPDECGLSSVVTKNPEKLLYLNSFCFFFRFNNLGLVDPDFAKHLFRSSDLRYQIGKTANGVTRFNVSKKMMEKVVIPIPPLPVQQEIVRILDTFTELTARKKQYEYYRDELLTFGDGVQTVQLAKCTEKISKIKWEEADYLYEYIDLSSVDREMHSILTTTTINKESAPSRAQQIVETDDVLFGSTRPMLKRSCLVSEQHNQQVCSTGFCVLRANKSIILPKWIYFNINTTDFYNHVEMYQKGASYPAISNADIKKYEIPLPSLEEQQRIVDILDRFDALCNDISIGLPAEIDARQKQYEYYRDKLLTFKEI